MIDFSDWHSKSERVSNLLLDPLNPRIPTTGAGMSQADLIAELVSNDRVYELARMIAKQGFHPVENLIVVKESGKLYVVEGNRRLAALKCLLSPDAAPEQFISRFRALSATVARDGIEEAPILIAPSREATRPILLARHTVTQIENWSPPMKARYYRSLLDTGMTANELNEEYQIPLAEIQDFLKRDTLYRMACSLDLPPEVLQKVQSPRTFPLTNLERAMDSSLVRTFLGIDLDDKHIYVGRVRPEEFKRGFGRIVADVANKKIDSRRLNKADNIKEYLSQIADSAPDKKKKGKFKAADLIAKPRPSPPVVQATSSRRAPRTPRSLVPPGFHCASMNKRIVDVFGELKALRVADFPNAVAMLFRTLLDLSVSDYLQREGHYKAAVAKFQRRENKGPFWAPTLRQLMGFMLDGANMQLPLHPQELRALKKIANEKDTPATLDSLDGFVHNRNLHPTEAELRAVWLASEPMLVLSIGPSSAKK